MTLPRSVPMAMTILIAGLMLACTSANQDAAGSQPAKRVAHPFRGKIEAVDVAGKKLTVNGENVEGWMGAMTMMYAPDKDDVLTRVKPGDAITATVYEGYFQTLYDVKVTAPR